MRAPFLLFTKQTVALNFELLSVAPKPGELGVARGLFRQVAVTLVVILTAGFAQSLYVRVWKRIELYLQRPEIPASFFTQRSGCRRAVRRPSCTLQATHSTSASPPVCSGFAP